MESASDEGPIDRPEPATPAGPATGANAAGVQPADLAAPGAARASDGPNVPAFPVVGVGASAGGLQAFRQLLRAMGDKPEVAIVYIQHLSPDHESMIASIVSKDTKMPVVEAGDAMRIERNSVYVIPPGKYLTVADHGLFLEPPQPRDGLRMPVDHFLSSLADQLGNRAIGVILSGTGTDGALGARQVKAAGGLLIVQDPDEAEYDGMPRAALGSGLADITLKTVEMPERIAAYRAHPYARGEDVTADVEGRDAFATITTLLSAQTAHDFRSYRRGTLVRRIMRRMSLRRLTDPAAYLKVLRSEPDELRALFGDLLIGVTRFFREPEAWATIESEIVPDLVRRAREEKRPIRAWVPGCSTGEEAYTLAMLLHEAREREGGGVDYQIFATDLNERAVSHARAAIYPPNIADDLTPERLKQHFTEENGQLRVKKSLRERLVFAPHNLLRDPPFLRTDFVSCRNLLIYLEPKVQARVLDVFGFSLRRGGTLFLGASEGAGGQHRGFDPVSSKWRIYRKMADARSSIPIAERRLPPVDWVARDSLAGDREAEDLIATAQTALLSRFAPASIVVGIDGTARYFAGPVGRFLTVPAGRPTANVLDMVSPELRSRLRSALHQAQARGDRVSLLAPLVPLSEGARSVTVEAEPLTEGDGPILVTLSADVTQATPEVPEGEDDARDAIIARLESELRAVRDDLQSMIEELETTNEELKASNEEATSVNEEMQSANEELETSREELQSMNEELSTVNTQLEEKIDEMEGLYDDLSNLLRSTDLAVLFLDNDMRIRRFTPSATKLLNVMDADLERPVSHLALANMDADLLRDANEVRRDLSPRTTEVSLADAGMFARTIRPFRTSEDRIDGVVVVYVDISAQHQALSTLARRERQARAVADLGRPMVGGADLEGFMREVCRITTETLDADFAKVLRYDKEADDFLMVAGLGWDAEVGSTRVPNDQTSQAGYTRASRSPVLVDDLETETRFKGPPLLTDHEVRSGISCPIGPREGSYGVLGVHSRRTNAFEQEDVAFLESVASLVFSVVQHQRSIDALASRERTLRLATEAAGMAAFAFDPETDDAQLDAVGYALFDLDPEVELTGQMILDRIVEEDRPLARTALSRAVEDGEPYRAEFRVRHRDGSIHWIAGHGDVANTEGRVFGVNFEITERKAMEERQRLTAAELDHRVKNVLATVSSIVAIAGQSARSFEEFRRSFDARIQLLARTHARLAEAKWTGLDIRALIEAELGPYRADDITFDVGGPSLFLSPIEAQPVALALHELTTNSAKYGAIHHRGAIGLTWFMDDAEGARLNLRWRESGVGPVEPPEARGFGTSVIVDMMAHELDAEVRLDWGQDGIDLRYSIPLSRTDAHLPIGVGTNLAVELRALEAQPVDLRGQRILVVEDEYFVAQHIAELLRMRGAHVIGPASRLEQASRLAADTLDLAILDYNVGGVSAAGLLKDLLAREVPTVLATGYGEYVELDGIDAKLPRIRKPIEAAHLDAVLGEMIGREVSGNVPDRRTGS